MNQKQIMKRYAREFILSMVAYIVVLITSIYAIKNIGMAQSLRIIVTLLPAIPVTFVIIAVMRSIRDSDELQQRVQLLAITFAACLTGLITFTYGFLENVGFPKFPTHFVLPLIIALWGISLAWFSKRYQ